MFNFLKTSKCVLFFAASETFYVCSLCWTTSPLLQTLLFPPSLGLSWNVTMPQMG